MSDFERALREWFFLPPVPAQPGLRRCLEGHRLRALPGACPACGGLLVGRALASVYSGEEERLAAELRRREKARSLVRTLIQAVWALVVLRVLAYLIFDGALRALIVLVTSAVIALVFHAAIVLVARVLLEALRGRATHGEHVEDLEKKLDDLAERLLEPFLARNAIAENGPVRSSPEELALLEGALAQEGLVPRHGSLPLLLASAALRRDLRRFKERLVATGTSDWYLACARTSADERAIPFLEEVLADEGIEPVDVAEQVRLRRSQGRLETFLGDLEQRRAGEALSVTIEMLDALPAASFEGVVAFLLEVEGYEKRAPAVFERHGEKTALVVVHSGEPLEAPSVQRALLARTEQGCARALVVANAPASEAARAVASENRIELVDRDALRARLDAFNRTPKDYARLAALLAPGSAP